MSTIRPSILFFSLGMLAVVVASAAKSDHQLPACTLALGVFILAAAFRVCGE